MKSKIIACILLLEGLFTASFAQQTVVARVTFMLKNTLGYARMFRVEGTNMAYGFNLSKQETLPCNWPVGAKLYFSDNGKTNGDLILTVTADDEGKTLVTDRTIAKTGTASTITFSLKNSSLLPKKVTLVSYAPGETGNGTNGFVIPPKGSRTVSFPAGTKLYLADSEQVDIVMSGKRIDSEKPFRVVTKEDAGKSFPIH